MPRGRHRHSPPLHRLLPPSAIAGVSLVCALGPWVFTAPALLRSLAAAAAVTAIGGAFVMRRWDAQAGRQVADLTRARASDEWRFEERVAELESDLEESRELRVRLEQKLRAKRTELAGLRNEHAALLRRYATAETERASALEGRRLLEIEAAPDTRALPAAPAAPTAPGAPGASGAATVPASGAGASGPATVPASGVVASGAVTAPGSAAAAVSGTSAAPAASAVAGDAAAEETGKPAGVAPAVFSPEGSRLFRAAGVALARLAKDEEPAPGTAAEPAPEPSDAAGAEPTAEPSDAADAEPAADAADDVSAEPSDDASAEQAAEASEDAAPAAPETPTGPTGGPTGGPTTGPSGGAPAEATAAPGTDIDAEVSPARGDDVAEAAEGRPETADGHEPTAAAPAEEPTGRGGEAADAAVPQAGARPAQRPAGHFTVPTAVAVVPPAPVRRPAVEGGFDFFGTKKGAPPAALEAVQNEDLADVVGQEALALHKAEAESQYRPADAGTHAVGQVIDLTAHDETEQIDVQNLRSAAS
ncbi:hypothetical protein ACF1BS_28520 [Streptomyces sp. NPDC014748]|uniref:hypothetical protein n=1 Tax=Streptomyces sp. NPDC014748 TaxID=3364905 RepID=UPI0037002225